jgi:transposase-like protein
MIDFKGNQFSKRVILYAVFFYAHYDVSDRSLSERHFTAAARRFFKRAAGINGAPNRIAIDKSGANPASLKSLNIILKFTGAGGTISINHSKSLNNIVEQDPRNHFITEFFLLTYQTDTMAKISSRLISLFGAFSITFPRRKTII